SVITQMILQEVLIRIGRSTFNDATFFHMHQVQDPILPLDTINIIGYNGPLRTAEFSSTCVIAIGSVAFCCRNSAGQVQVVIGNSSNVIARLGAVQSTLDISVGIIGIIGSPSKV